ncbi:PAS domain S-box protein [Leptolyngbya sp. KIOST-1]|uniref:PAS domain S-box protein n=1 Tax=Leptolyngbya sp. KIOST-1 TaxID=1229172 RepID=UPI00068E91D6|nr:PAS domain S-box protein [Leptolyngbya sp. KIOST-1]
MALALALTNGAWLIQSILRARRRSATSMPADPAVTERALQVSEARYRAIVEDQTELIFRSAVDTTLLFVNGAFCRYFGLDRDEILGQSYNPVIYEPDRAWVAQRLRLLGPDNPTVTVENRVVVRGEIRWTQWVSRLLLDKQGHWSEVQSVGRDITDLKRAEEALRQSEKRLLDAQRIARVGSWAFEIATQELSWSEALFHIFGLDPTQPPPTFSAYLRLIHPDDRRRLQRTAQRAISTGNACEIEHRIVQPGGAVRHVLGRAEVQRDERGRVVRLMGTALDITDRKRMEAALQESEARFHTLMANLPGMIYRYCPGNPETAGQFTYASAGAYDLLELTPAQVQADASALWRLIHPDDLVDLQASVGSAVEAGTDWHWEGRLTTPSGTLKWIQGHSRPQQTDSGTVWDGLLIDISDRKFAELTLRQSEARYLSILEDQTELITRFQPDGTLVFVNDAFCRYYDLPREQLLGQSYKPRIYPDDQPLIDRCLAALTPENPIGQVEHRVFAKGMVRWTQWTNQIIYNAQGEFVELQSVGRDIHDRKQAELALQQSERRYATLTNGSPVGIFRFNPAGECLYVNPRWCEMTGYRAAEGFGLGWMRTIHPDDRDRLWADWQAVLNQKASFRGEGRHLTRAGEVRWFDCQVVPELDEGGDLLGYIGTVSDITDRKRAELALQQSETRFQKLASASPAVIYTVVEGPRGVVHFDYLSPAAEQIHEIPLDTLLQQGHLVSDQIHPDDREPYAQTYQACRQAMVPFRFEWRIVTPSGQIKWLRASSGPEARADGTVAWHGIVLDISDRKQAEAQLQQVQAALLEAQRIAHISNWSFDLESQTISWSPELFRMFGLKPDQGEPSYGDYLTMVHPDDRVVLQQSIARAIEAGTPYTIDYRALLPDGSMRYHEGRGEVARNAEGKVTGLFGTALDITERKQIELALQASETRFRAIFEQAAVGINQADGSGRYVEVNQYFCDLLGYTKDELLGLNYADLSHPDELAEQQPLFRNLFHQDSAILELEKRYRHKHGEWIWTSVTLSVIRDADGQPIADLAIVIDIRDRKRAEQALVQANQRMEAILAAFPDLIFYITADGRVYDFQVRDNRDLYSAPETFLNQTIQSILPPDTGERLYQAVQKTLAERTLVAIEYGLPLPTGEAFFDARIMPLDETSVIAVVRNISDRKQAEFELQRLNEDLERRVERRTQQLSQSEERLRLALAASQQGLYDLNIQTGEAITSPEYALMLGYDPATFSETLQQWLERLHPDDQATVAATYGAYIAGDISEYQVEFRQRTRSGDWKWILSTGKIVAWDEAGQPLRMLGIHTDLTNLKQAETALHQLNAELEQRIEARTYDLQQAVEAADAANQAKSLFLANMSHELRTPLNVILGFTQLMRHNRDLDPEQQDYIRIIHRSGDHLLHLINDILDLSKIEANRISLEVDSIDLLELLEDLCSMFQERADEKALAFRLKLAPDLPQHILIDPSKLRQVLINLLSNAIKFTQSGEVILEATLVHQDLALEPTLAFAVQDTGMGIAPDEQASIFDAFTQAKAGRMSLEGTGLGLAISHKIVSLMGGHLTVCSRLGQGSRFQFAIPLRLAQVSDVLPSANSGVVIGLAPGQPTYRILVVDDQPDNRQLLVKLLSQIGLSVQAVGSGAEAIARWQRWQPHLIWMDMRMPGMDGYETTRRIRAAVAQQPDLGTAAPIILAFTAQAASDAQRRALEAGCDDFLSKPIQLDLVLTKMAQYLDLRYRYDVPPPVAAASPAASLNSQTLQVMPPDWIAELHRAAIYCDSTDVARLIEQIPADFSPLIDGLNRLLHDYRFEVIMDLTQPQTSPD